MRFRYLAFVFSTIAGCTSSDANESTPTPSTDGGTSPVDPTSPGADAAASTSGVFWYASYGSQAVGVSDLSGTDIWSATIDDGKVVSIAIGAGSAWVMPESGNLRRYDLTSHTLVTTVAAVAKNPGKIVFAAGALWIADSNDGTACNGTVSGPAKLLRLEPATNTVVQRIPVSAVEATGPCNDFDDLRTDGTLVYALITNSFGAAIIDPASNTVTKRVALGTGAGYGTGYMTLGPSTLWVHNTNANTIIAVDPTALTVKSTTPQLGYLGEQMVASSTSIVMNEPGEKVLRIDATDPTKQIEATIPDEPDTFVFHAGVLYASVKPSLKSASLLTLDETTLTEKSRLELPVLANVDEIVFVP